MWNDVYTIAALAAVIAVLLVWICVHQRRLAERARLMREAIRNRDFMFRLPTDSRLPGERALQRALNDMGGEINRLLARNEVESWQRLTRVLTHEIMNSVAPIQSIAQAYATSPKVKGTPIEEGLRAIYDTSRHLTAFVDSYRKMTQLQKPSLHAVGVEQLALNLATLYPMLVWHVNTHCADTILADDTMMGHVLTNIVKNAVEAGAHNIDLTTRTEGDYISLAISNDGEPIKAEVAREIFVPFFSTKQSGSGIGLALSRQMMIAQGGDLALAPTHKPGYHTTFVVRTLRDNVKC